MTRPTIEGSPIHKASIAKAKAKAKARPVVSQSRTSADPSLVMAGDQLGKSFIPGAIDYRITTPKIDWGKEKKNKDGKGEDNRELDDIYNNVPEPDMSDYGRAERYPYTDEGSFGPDQEINTPEEEYAEPVERKQRVPIGLDRQDVTVGSRNNTIPAPSEVNDEGKRIMTGINANRGSDTTPVSTALPSGDVPTFSPEFGNLDVKAQSGQVGTASNQEMEIQEQEYPEPDLLRKEILGYGTPNMFPKNERQQITLPPTPPPSINNGGNVAPEQIDKVDVPDIKEPTTVPLAEDNRKYKIPNISFKGSNREDVQNVDEQGNQRPRFDEEGYGIHSDDQGNIMITYNGYEVDNYEEVPDGIFNAMTEGLNSQDVQGSEDGQETETNESKETTQEILDRGIIPNKEQKDNVVYEKPSRFDYPINMDEPSEGKINPKTKGRTYNEAVGLYEGQENNGAVQQRTQSIFRNAVPGGKVQSKLKKEGFNPYKSI